MDEGETSARPKKGKKETSDLFQNVYEKAVVRKVSDGDTIKIEDGSSIRIYGIDAPETFSDGPQPYGKEAKDRLTEILEKNNFEVVLKANDGSVNEDKYHRKIRSVYLDDGGEVDVALILLKEGLAWAYREYLKKGASPLLKTYVDAENEARRKGLGIWDPENPDPYVEPKYFRMNRKNEAAKRKRRVKRKWRKAKREPVF